MKKIFIFLFVMFITVSVIGDFGNNVLFANRAFHFSSVENTAHNAAGLLIDGMKEILFSPTIVNAGDYVIERVDFRFYGRTPISEPAIMLLIGTGIIGVAGFLRRKFRLK